jgi:hypothetical protein
MNTDQGYTLYASDTERHGPGHATLARQGVVSGNIVGSLARNRAQSIRSYMDKLLAMDNTEIDTYTDELEYLVDIVGEMHDAHLS